MVSQDRHPFSCNLFIAMHLWFFRMTKCNFTSIIVNLFFWMIGINDFIFLRMIYRHYWCPFQIPFSRPSSEKPKGRHKRKGWQRNAVTMVEANMAVVVLFQWTARTAVVWYQKTRQLRSWSFETSSNRLQWRISVKQASIKNTSCLNSTTSYTTVFHAPSTARLSAIDREKHVVFVNHFCKFSRVISCAGYRWTPFSLRRPQQGRQPGGAGGPGGQGNTGAGGQRGGNKPPLQPANIPVAKSRCSSASPCVRRCLFRSSSIKHSLSRAQRRIINACHRPLSSFDEDHCRCCFCFDKTNTIKKVHTRISCDCKKFSLSRRMSLQIQRITDLFSDVSQFLCSRDAVAFILSVATGVSFDDADE